jgi:hypothetical protein
MKKTLLGVQILLVVVVTLALASAQRIAQCDDDNIWYVHDVIDASLEQVKWVEDGGIRQAPGFITDGSWYQASMRESLVTANDIFVETYEQFNWTLVKPMVEYYYEGTFNTFDDFGNFVKTNPDKWLDLSWQMDTDWYGIFLNATKVKYSFNDTANSAEMYTWFHITRIPEYFAGEGKLESWLTGFDLTPVSTGSLKLFEFHKEWSKSGVAYNLRFIAPANILTQHENNYTLIIPVSADYRGYTFGIQQAIEVNMPPNTEVKEASPANMSLLKGNTGSFVIARGDRYPTAFTVVSGSPTKSFGQAFWEGASLWFVTPGGWAAIATLSVLSFTALRGRRIWHRSKLYHRLYKSLVTVYDMYSKDLMKFNLEMDNISRTIIRVLVEDKITDDQFEKLLQRRDDLLQRVQ